MKEEIKEKLKELADEKYRQFHSKLCPGTENILGIRIPVLRNYAKELVKQYPVKELLEKIGNEYYEEVMLQGMVIGLAKEEINMDRTIYSKNRQLGSLRYFLCRTKNNQKISKPNVGIHTKILKITKGI